MASRTNIEETRLPSGGKILRMIKKNKNINDLKQIRIFKKEKRS